MSVERMKVIHRHPIRIDDADHVVDTCCSSKVVFIGNKANEPNHVQVWVEEACGLTERMARTFRVFGTGQVIPEGYHYKGSTVAGPYVWHVYERSQYPRD